MAEKKKFGLVMPKRTGAFQLKKNSIFQDDSDEDERAHKRPKISQKKMESKCKLKTESVEDPSIYEYDDIYDEMKRKQTEALAPKEKKNSRYIETLMKAAEKRKKEYERRIDKKIQAEREKEGDEYKDKEAFVTSSYKQKMLEQEEEEQKERHENMLNDMMDVTKQKDLSGFYRHFLKQTVGEEKVLLFGERQIKEEIVSDEESSHKHNESLKSYENIDEDSDNVEVDDNESVKSNGRSDTEKQGKKLSSDSEKQSMEQISDNSKLKTFRSRKHNRTHYRKLKESSKLSASSSEGEQDNLHTGKSLHSDKSNATNLHNSRRDSFSSSINDNDEPNEKSLDIDVDCGKSTKENLKIFDKRTVGDIFAEAQARYFQRMASQKAEI